MRNFKAALGNAAVHQQIHRMKFDIEQNAHAFDVEDSLSLFSSSPPFTILNQSRWHYVDLYVGEVDLSVSLRTSGNFLVIGLQRR